MVGMKVLLQKLVVTMRTHGCDLEQSQVDNNKEINQIRFEITKSFYAKGEFHFPAPPPHPRLLLVRSRRWQPALVLSDSFDIENLLSATTA